MGAQLEVSVEARFLYSEPPKDLQEENERKLKQTELDKAVKEAHTITSSSLIAMLNFKFGGAE